MTGQTYSYGALLDAWRRCGGALQRRGIKYGDVVCMLMLNSPAFGVVFPGVFAAGAVPSPINSTYTAGKVTGGGRVYSVTEMKDEVIIGGKYSMEMCS